MHNNGSNFMNRSNLEFVDQLYSQYLTDPNSVEEQWQYFFQGVEFGQDKPSGDLSEKELNVYNLIQAFRHYGHLEADLDPLTNTPAPNDQLSLHRFDLDENDLGTTFTIGRVLGLENPTLQQIIEFLRSRYCGKISVQVGDAFPDIRDWFYDEFESQNMRA